MLELPEKIWKKPTLKDLIRKIAKTGRIKRYPGSGRSRIVRTPENISTVGTLICNQGNDDTHAVNIGKFVYLLFHSHMSFYDIMHS